MGALEMMVAFGVLAVNLVMLLVVVVLIVKFWRACNALEGMARDMKIWHDAWERREERGERGGVRGEGAAGTVQGLRAGRAPGANMYD